jgi:hypothetical protein
MEFPKILKFLFKNKRAEICASTAFAIGLAMIYGDDSVLGFIFVCLAGAWVITAWTLSDELARRKPVPPKKRKYIQVAKYKEARNRYLLWKFTIPAGIIVFVVLSAAFTNQKREEKLLKEYAGFLLPGDEPDPPSFCSTSVDPDALKMFVGRNEVFSNKFPFVVLRVSKHDRIVIERDDSGRIALNMDILDESGKVIVSFEHGKFTVVQGNILDMKRTKSSLVVRDQYKKEVLNVRYLNRKSLQFSGSLHYPGIGLVVLPSSDVDGMCVGDTGVAFDIE